MPRQPRLTVPGLPHHITQRGNRRQQTFFEARDYQVYLNLLATYSAPLDVKIWAYCLMPNHTHVVAVPGTERGLSSLMAEVHRRYTRHINFRMGWTGHLWQSRYASFVMDDAYTRNCVRYVELNPVRANLCAQPTDWPWSSARAHLSGRDDGVCTVAPMLERIEDWSTYLSEPVDRDAMQALNRHDGTNWPLGSAAFVRDLETRSGLRLRPKRPL